MSARCISCGSDTQVKDSRPTAGGLGIIRRRRMCLKCGERYTTLEFSARDLERLVASRVAQQLSAVRDVVRVVNDAIQGTQTNKAAGRVSETLFAPDLIEELEGMERERLASPRERLENYQARISEDPANKSDPTQ